MAGNSAAVAEMKEIAALMRDSGLQTSASSGWESRGRSSSVNYWAVLCHHTAAVDDIDNMLINGRPDLAGPLCNWALHEYGEWVMIASGRANHAGEGTLPSSESYGIEATGPQGYPGTYGPAAFPGNYNSYEVGVACMLAVMGGDTGDVFGHKETATPPGRKIDPYFDMNPFRKGVASGPTIEDDEMTKEEFLEACRSATFQEAVADGVNSGMNKALVKWSASTQLIVSPEGVGGAYALAAGQLFHFPSGEIANSYLGGNSLSEATLYLGPESPVWDLPINGKQLPSGWRE